MEQDNKRIKVDKENKEIMEKENQNREQKRKNNVKKTEILQRRWEMYG